MNFLWVGVGGFLGAICRYCFYLVERSMGTSGFPWATLTVNIVGCFLAGILFAKVETSSLFSNTFVLVSSVGFLGAFTTFSAFSLDVLQLIKSGYILAALLNIAANVLLGIYAVWFGHRLIVGV